MSFYVDTQALQIGLGHFRPDLARLSLADIKVHPDVKVKVEKITNPLDSKGEYAAECLTLDVEGIPVLLASAPFRSGYDIWVMDRKTGFGQRIGP